MANIDAVIKVADQLIYRIFDQRQFTSGAINHHIKEINGNGSKLETDFDRLLKMNETTCLIADKNDAGLYTSFETAIKDTSKQVGLLVDRAERILKLNDDIREKSNQISKEQHKQSIEHS